MEEFDCDYYENDGLLFLVMEDSFEEKDNCEECCNIYNGCCDNENFIICILNKEGIFGEIESGLNFKMCNFLESDLELGIIC